ncbi:shikimate dehydrogenase (NADP(+)) [Marinobacterium zhoushanense]|uniref:Shikimate dehydrogenase (NADP(+)) n=1 Tax=Marinobacterium zhoushanense TaxID=1679163 RepID=A0ABQ1KU36_9GAMM|nr:shikimate dehydrogenase [Marinobacterium zhoushanense]GGC10420.1 shikimate dehydrogenase (NADP(+)) [Marinobacterium zhoushanense]
MADRYAVFGNPIKHSKSPRIHAAFAEQTGEAVDYRAQLVELGTGVFEQQVEQFFAEGGKGLNITVPFKQNAWRMASWRSAAAERAGAVNTLYRNELGTLCGDNTDGVGLVCDLQNNNGISLKGARVLMLGAGGAVRGVLEPFLKAGAVEIVIANRTVAKAQELVELFSDLGQLSACGFEDIEARAFDVIVNGTSASLQGELPPLPDAIVGADSACYDMMYGAQPTPFCNWASQRGAAKVIDGLGMLIEQAAESFRIWRGVKPQTPELIAQIRAELSG